MEAKVGVLILVLALVEVASVVVVCSGRGGGNCGDSFGCDAGDGSRDGEKSANITRQ